MAEPRPLLTIGAFARAAGVGVETVRYYQRRGVLPEPARPPGQVRRYGLQEVERLRFIKSAQKLGFTLDEVQVLIGLEDGTHCSQAQELAAHKLCDVRERLVALHRIEETLAQLVNSCRAHQGVIACPLIVSLGRSIAAEYESTARLPDKG